MREEQTFVDSHSLALHQTLYAWNSLNAPWKRSC